MIKIRTPLALASLLASLVCLHVAAGARQQPPADFAFLVGEWEGKLEYLDYKDNKSRVTLGVTMSARAAGGGVEYAFVYTEPNGSKVEGKPTLLRGAPGLARFGEEEWQLLRAEADAAARHYQVALTRQGSDGGRPASLRRTFAFKDGELRIRNEARAEGSGDYTLRNEYTLRPKR
jgi:hypothetical protein